MKNLAAVAGVVLVMTAFSATAKNWDETDIPQHFKNIFSGNLSLKF